jgi:putative ATPase
MNLLTQHLRVIVLERLTDNDIREVLQNALAKIGLAPNSGEPSLVSFYSSPSEEPVVRRHSPPSTTIIEKIVSYSLGDARTALSLLEIVANTRDHIDDAVLGEMLRSTVVSRYVLLITVSAARLHV